MSGQPLAAQKGPPSDISAEILVTLVQFRRPPCASNTAVSNLSIPALHHPSRSAQRFERRPKFCTKEFWLLPGGEVTALGQAIVVDQVRKGLLGPTARRGVDLVGKGAHRDRNGDTLGREERELALPEETGRRNGRLGQPVERDVVEDVVTRQALRLPVEHPSDELLAGWIMVEHPCGKTDRRILQGVERLGACAHFLRVADTVL